MVTTRQVELPITAEFPLSEVAEAHRLMVSRALISQERAIGQIPQR